MPPPRSPTPAAMEWTNERIRRFWDYESRHPENYYSFKYGEQIVDRAAQILGLSPGPETTWLDFGCGYGSLTELLLGRGFSVVIDDLSPDSLAECARRCAGHPGFRGTLADSPGQIDLVALIEVVEHVEQHDLAEIVAGLRRDCGPGTRLVVTTPNSEDLEAQAITVYCPSCDTTRHRWQHLRSFTRDSLARQLTALGLGDVRVFEENFRRDKRFKTANPLRRLKRLVCDYRLYASADRPNLLAIGEL